MGKDVSDEVAELTGSPDKIISLIKRNEIDRVIQKKDRISIKKEYSEPKYDNNILSFLHDEKRMDVLKMASSLEINDKSRLHSALIQYKKRITEYNKRLKDLARRAQIRTNLTSYVTRHTWASLAYHRNTELAVISKALGHTNPNTTQIYIREIDDNRLAEANRALLGQLLEPNLI